MFRGKLILLLLAVTNCISLQAVAWLSSEPEYSKKNIIKAIEKHTPNRLIKLLKNTDHNEFNEYDLQNALNLARKISSELKMEFEYWDYTKLYLSLPCAFGMYGGVGSAGFVLLKFNISLITGLISLALAPISLIFFSYQFHQSLKKYKQYKNYQASRNIVNILENHIIGISLELQLPKLALSNN